MVVIDWSNGNSGEKRVVGVGEEVWRGRCCGDQEGVGVGWVEFVVVVEVVVKGMGYEGWGFVKYGKGVVRGVEGE